MQRLFCLLPFMFSTLLLSAQLAEKKDTAANQNDRAVYTVGYAHLDTEWNWDYPATINRFIKNTMVNNFQLFGQYPQYVFNFTGSRRYGMMKEYYPDLYQKVRQYIQQGRWYVSGSSVDEGDVNIPSSESVIRQVLYGNNFFRKEFGKESLDYMLPDCFGFPANMPSIWHHCGLLGFSTQKLTWKSAAGIPFNVGIWKGPDGKGIIAALNATNYAGRISPRFDRDSAWDERLNDNIRKYRLPFDYRYYGIGDRGGAPREEDVKNVIESLDHSDSKFKVLLTSSDQMFKDITPEIYRRLPVYTGDLLLTEHSTGSLTSQSYMKRANRKNELLAQSAEIAASMARWMCGTAYPYAKLNDAWGLVLGSQFHDIMAGTSIPKAYEYAWNDELIAANGFAEVLKSSVRSISRMLNTGGKGKAVVVYNPVAHNREDVVTAWLKYSRLPDGISVFDKDGREVPSQIIERNEGEMGVIFLARLPAQGMTVFDVRPAGKKTMMSTLLAVTARSLENEYYKVKVDENGDVASIWDKRVSRELLLKPARLEFLSEHPAGWPAWNMDWKDRQQPAAGYMDKDVSITVKEEGPVRVTLQISRKGFNSSVVQLLSLSSGEAGKRIEWTNTIDWQSKEVSLKAAFPLSVHNETATYNLGVGAIGRGNNNPLKYEVPSREWFDLTDKSGSYGISVLEDCKYGSDKPDNNTLRLTLLYTPKTGDRFIYQNTQDWGIHDVKYALYGHSGNWSAAEVPWQAKFLNQPLIAFEAPEHEGVLGKEFSFISLSSPQTGLMAFKKMENSDYFLIRINELYGKDVKDIKLEFPARIADAYEVNGQEQRIGNANLSGRSLNTDLSAFSLRSFAVKLEDFSVKSTAVIQQPVVLPYNQDVVSFDTNRGDGHFDSKGLTLPAELLPAELISENIRFQMGPAHDRQNNAVSCAGQKLHLPAGKFNKLYILAAATEDTSGTLSIDNRRFKMVVGKWTGYTGQFYNRKFLDDKVTVSRIDKAFVRTDNIAWFASHRHSPTGNDAYRYSYIFKYEFSLPQNARTVILPVNYDIKIFAATVANDPVDDITLFQPLYDDFSDSKKVLLRKTGDGL